MPAKGQEFKWLEQSLLYIYIYICEEIQKSYQAVRELKLNLSKNNRN